MKKLMCLCLLMSLILVSCAAQALENTEHIIGNVADRFEIGETCNLLVRDADSNEIIPNANLLWSSSDLGVAVVDGNGKVIVNGEGMCIIYARSKENLEHFSSVKIFSPYKTVNIVDAKTTRLDASSDPFDFYSVLEVAIGRYGKTAISFLEGDVESAVWDLIIDAFSKDVYWYSNTALDCQVKDGIVYTVTDWCNSAIDFNLNNINVANVHKSVEDAFSESIEMGVTFNDVISKIKTELVGCAPNDSVYHLDRMDDRYEYRVVIRGDYTGCISREHYSNGLLTNVESTWNDIVNGNLEHIIENYAYTVVRGEIINLENLRICIEAREK